MTEQMIVEAVKAAGGTGAPQDPAAVNAIDRVPSVDAVQRFEAAMAADPVPFASEVSAVWRSAEANNQGILHRIHALSQMSASHSLSGPEMIELQYEVANLAFQQEVVTKVADKSSNAIQTLIKNQ